MSHHNEIAQLIKKNESSPDGFIIWDSSFCPDVDYSNGDRKITSKAPVSEWRDAKANLPLPDANTYVELTTTGGDFHAVGLTTPEFEYVLNNSPAWGIVGALSYGYFNTNGTLYYNGIIESTESPYTAAVIGLYWRKSDGGLFFSENGYWQNSTDGTFANASPIWTGVPSGMYLIGSTYFLGSQPETIEINSGQDPFVYPSP